jgi:hypothetical protein
MFAEFSGCSDPEFDSMAAMCTSPSSTSVGPAAPKRDAEEMEEEVVTEIPAVNYGDLDAKKLVVKPRTFRQEPLLSVRYDGNALLVTLTPGEDEWLRMPFGMDRVGMFVDKDMSICGGKGKEYEALRVVFALPENVAEALMKIDAAVQAECLKLHPDKPWKPCCERQMSGEYLISASVVVKTRSEEDHGTTAMMVKLPGKAPKQGQGVAFLKPILDGHNDLKGRNAKAQLQLKKGYVAEKAAGLNFVVMALMVDVPAAPKAAWPASFVFKKK